MRTAAMAHHAFFVMAISYRPRRAPAVLFAFVGAPFGALARPRVLAARSEAPRFEPDIAVLVAAGSGREANWGRVPADWGCLPAAGVA